MNSTKQSSDEELPSQIMDIDTYADCERYYNSYPPPEYLPYQLMQVPVINPFAAILNQLHKSGFIVSILDDYNINLRAYSHFMRCNTGQVHAYHAIRSLGLQPWISIDVSGEPEQFQSAAKAIYDRVQEEEDRHMKNLKVEIYDSTRITDCKTYAISRATCLQNTLDIRDPVLRKAREFLNWTMCPQISIYLIRKRFNPQGRAMRVIALAVFKGTIANFAHIEQEILAQIPPEKGEMQVAFIPMYPTIDSPATTDTQQNEIMDVETYLVSRERFYTSYPLGGGVLPKHKMACAAVGPFEKAFGQLAIDDPDYIERTLEQHEIVLRRIVRCLRFYTVGDERTPYISIDGSGDPDDFATAAEVIHSRFCDDYDIKDLVVEIYDSDQLSDRIYPIPRNFASRHNLEMPNAASMKAEELLRRSMQSCGVYKMRRFSSSDGILVPTIGIGVDRETTADFAHIEKQVLAALPRTTRGVQVAFFPEDIDGGNARRAAIKEAALKWKMLQEDDEQDSFRTPMQTQSSVEFVEGPRDAATTFPRPAEREKSSKNIEGFGNMIKQRISGCSQS